MNDTLNSPQPPLYEFKLTPIELLAAPGLPSNDSFTQEPGYICFYNAAFLNKTLIGNTDLKAIDVYGKSITMAPWIGEMTHIRSLRIMGNVSQPLPSQLMNMHQLEVFVIQRNDSDTGNVLEDMTQLNQLAQFRQLMDFRFTNCSLTKIPDSLYTCSGLKCLMLIRNDIDVVDPLKFTAWPRLELIDLSYNHLVTFSGTERLDSVKGVFLKGNQLEQIPREIFTSGTLGEVDLSFNPIKHFTADLAQYILKQCPNLYRLTLTNTEIPVTEQQVVKEILGDRVVFTLTK